MKLLKSIFAITTSFIMLLSTAQSVSYSAPNKNEIAKPSAVNAEMNKIHPALRAVMKDSSQDIVSVIVAKSPNNSAVDTAKLLGATVKAEWEFINAFAIDIKASMLDELATLSDVYMITEEGHVMSTKEKDEGTTDDKVASPFDGSIIENAFNASVKADKVWEKGYTGQGVTIAVLDTGIYEGPNSDFNKRLIKSVNVNPNASNGADKYGHGTHVAGIIAGDGKNSGGKYMGIAPDANLISVKFADDNGMSSEMDLLNALQWVYENKDEYNIRVVNISSTLATKQRYQESMVSAAVELLWASGVVVVVAAGNSGYEECSTCHAPANDPFVITVGAVDDNGTKSTDDDYEKPWSSSGETMAGISKPEIMAPGAKIVSYMPEGELKKMAKGNVENNADYFRMGGTSMAAPMVTGVVALMLEANPNLTPNQIKYILMHSARDYVSINKEYLQSLSREELDALDIDNIDPQYLEVAMSIPGIVSADKAVDWALKEEVIPSANMDYQINPILTHSDDSVLHNNVTWANVTWANVTWANVTWANVTWANVTWANVTWANVTWANVTWANVTWANVTWANVTWANSFDY
ncbi:hypothetical protein CIB95_12045 [Lottiidibacillus patelloidae]|uniref:Peptidase S8/S53 domain-containing protein n=1 Tax=Lottiidibacillus patelloidae TaxID=2670334 RepID=A0A263BS11_9BACI|nr:S8 family serine peptidase [Lottiidibacillus patelloidae]OZM56500.1 hypothetical protein CIB95_12045 [Lottiidibacillus patelloidae]